MPEYIVTCKDNEGKVIRSNVLNKVKEWLEIELKNNEPILDGIKNWDELTDERFDIHVGRNKCANALLEQIKKWEK